MTWIFGGDSSYTLKPLNINKKKMAAFRMHWTQKFSKSKFQQKTSGIHI